MGLQPLGARLRRRTRYTAPRTASTTIALFIFALGQPSRI